MPRHGLLLFALLGEGLLEGYASSSASSAVKRWDQRAP